MLEPLVFVGGTMLRLCHELDRYAADLDFWLIKKVSMRKYFKDIVSCLAKSYTITDAQIKFYTILIELKSDKSPRKLKIEIRKEKKKCDFEERIAFSRFSNIQVLLKVATPQQMMKSKIKAFIDRGEIRDCFDIEFLLRRGIELDKKKSNLKMILDRIEKFKPTDYKVHLGSLLDVKVRKYYVRENFNFLIEKIKFLLV